MSLDKECEQITRKAFDNFKHNIENAPFEVLPKDQEKYIETCLRMMQQEIQGGIGKYIFLNNLKGLNETHYKEKYYNIALRPAVVFARRFYEEG